MAQAVELLERPEAITCGTSTARRLRPPQRQGLAQYFEPTDSILDLGRVPVAGPLLLKGLKSRLFQFLFILPNQAIFWIVIVTGLFGATLPTRNFATVITWYVWFLVVFMLMVGVGRAWCLMCPFGGFAEWVQRRTFWGRRPGSIGLNLRWPKSWSRLGLLPAVGLFLGLTWFEEFYNIAGPGDPRFTAYLVLFIISFAVIIFLVFERRTFCRYLCPLSGLIGTVGSTGMVAGLRTKDRDVCLSCATKDCMRGSENGYPCPWYEWPGSATTNLTCGLCTECVKNCPHDNVGLFIQRPLTSIVAPVRRRIDIAWSVMLLFGLVLFQQVNALPIYGPIDDWLNGHTHFASYPNPIDFAGVIAAVTLLFAGYVWLVRAVLGRGAHSQTGDVARRRVRTFGAWLTPLAYGFIPLVGADYLARNLPRFWYNAPKVLPSLSDPFGFGWNLFGTAHLSLAKMQILSTQGVVVSQVAVVGLGTLAALYASLRIVHRDMRTETAHSSWLASVTGLAVGLAGVAVAVLYVTMGGTQ